ncbi:alpha/beta hydrolase [Arthrobacter sp. SA17]
MTEATAVVVAIHGLMESSHCLSAAFPHWISRGWAVLEIDLRGHGSSPRWSAEALKKHPGDVMVQDVLEVLKSRELRPVAHLPVLYYGHSAGGSVAAVAAASGLEQKTSEFLPAGVLLEDPFWRLPITSCQDRSVAEAAYAHLVDVQARPPGNVPTSDDRNGQIGAKRKSCAAPQHRRTATRSSFSTAMSSQPLPGQTS